MEYFWIIKGKVNEYKTSKIDFGGKILVLLQTNNNKVTKMVRKDFLLLKKSVKKTIPVYRLFTWDLWTEKNKKYSIFLDNTLDKTLG